MALYKYNKYKISLAADSKKTQGLRAGDIIRRQYFDGKNIIYSLMCVLSQGIDTNILPNGKQEQKPYFIGALLEGDAPKTSELLDFARITSLFNTDRTGALYLTASDSSSPYMDVLDNLGKNKSLSWPESVASEGLQDPQRQYVIYGNSLAATYTPSKKDNYRICNITRQQPSSGNFEGIRQDFYQYIEHPNQVLISYKVKANKPTELQASLGYSDGLKTDALWTEEITTEWQYKFKVVTVEHSGRHLRTFKLAMNNLGINDQVQVADFNIILLSSVANFGDASTTRIGKLEGVHDKVFGQLDGYGAYIQKLYASRSVHISGTLTAGDENGFGATFYAGKIHRNCFVNSIDIATTTSTEVATKHIVNPTGIGKVYQSHLPITMRAQSYKWKLKNVAENYCFSFWIYTETPGNFTIKANDLIINTISATSHQTHEWRREHVCFQIPKPKKENEALMFTIHPTFTDNKFDKSQDVNKALFYFTAPQLESGTTATQYQPTDHILNETGDYGAWFARGGIGGTIQNPLLKLNPDGSIASRNGSFVISPDGSGYFANGKFKWDQDKIALTGIKIKWEDLSPDAQEELKPKSIQIEGASVFAYRQETYIPSSIDLQVIANNFTIQDNNVAWSYLAPNGVYALLDADCGKVFKVLPEASYWHNQDTLTIKCTVNDNLSSYYGTITIQKNRPGESVYSTQIIASNGNIFKNNQGSTTLTAKVYYGTRDITDTLHPKDFDWIKTSTNTQTDKIFNAQHQGWGNKLTITPEDVFGRAQFDCKVRINK